MPRPGPAGPLRDQLPRPEGGAFHLAAAKGDLDPALHLQLSTNVLGQAGLLDPGDVEGFDATADLDGGIGIVGVIRDDLGQLGGPV